MLRISACKLASYTIALLLQATTAYAVLPAGSLNDGIPSLVYNALDGSLWIDTGADFGGPSHLYNVSVSSDYGIFNPFNATGVVWFATDYTLVTLSGLALEDGTVIGDPGFMYDGEAESFLQDDLTFIFQLDPFGGAFTSDLVYFTGIPNLPGDLNGDGFVGIADLNIVLGAWNQSVPPGDPLADPSGDGFVGIADLNIVLGNWNAGTPPGETANIPEPGTAAVLAIALGAGVLRRFRM